VEKPKDQIIVIDSKWVFKEKEIEIEVKKARLVARGYKQCDANYEMYSPVARMLSVRILLSLSIEKGMYICQLDVKCAFLNGELKEPVYMQLPDGIQGDSKNVCKLNKALYGLRQAPRCWYEKLHIHLETLGSNVQSLIFVCIWPKTLIL